MSVTIKRRHVFGLIGAGAALAAPRIAVAQDFPRRQAIRVIVAQAAGSATDTLGRVVAGRMAETLGQQVIVENRAGAGGLVGAEVAAKAAPDGYTLFVSNISTHGVNPGLYTSLPYDPIEGFASIGMAAETANLLIAAARGPFRTVADLIAHARANPGRVKFATAGEGSSQHLATELFAKMAGGLRLVHVPYRGSGPGVTAVMSGEVDWMLPAMPSAIPAIESGRARGIGVSTAARHPRYPETPTIAETLPGYEVTSWYGLSAPRGTPEPVIAQLNDALVKAVAHPEAVRGLTAVGLDPRSSTPAEFDTFIRAEIARWREVAQAGNIRISN
jgi:tripartite-type tricarboxylate transporter receptor subunit TctC